MKTDGEISNAGGISDHLLLLTLNSIPRTCKVSCNHLILIYFGPLSILPWIRACPKTMRSLLRRFPKNHWALGFLLLCALGLRVWNFPELYHVRSYDEIGYLSGGLLLWEGITPGFKMSPAGPGTWLVWGYAAGLSTKHLFFPEKREKPEPFPLRPYMAVDSALFELYRDLAPLRQGIVIVSILVSLWGVGAAFQMGAFRAGLPGGLLAGGLAAMTPMFILFSGMALPYSMGWSFALIAHYYAVTQTGQLRNHGAATFMALSISSRMEMLAFVPILVWEFWYRPESPPPLREIIKFCVTAVLGTLLISPWLITNLLGNARTFMTVRLFGPAIADTWEVNYRDFVWREGMAPTLFILIMGFAVFLHDSRNRGRILALIVALLLISLIKSTGYGMRHHGEVFIAIIAVAPLALLYVRRLWPRAVLPLVLPALFLPSFQAFSNIAEDNKQYIPDQATRWVNQNIPSGTTIYLRPTFFDPLPTQDSADTLWAEVTDQKAWRLKFQEGLNRLHISPISPPVPSPKKI